MALRDFSQKFLVLAMRRNTDGCGNLCGEAVGSASSRLPCILEESSPVRIDSRSKPMHSRNCCPQQSPRYLWSVDWPQAAQPIPERHFSFAGNPSEMPRFVFMQNEGRSRYWISTASNCPIWRSQRG